MIKKLKLEYKKLEQTRPLLVRFLFLFLAASFSIILFFNRYWLFNFFCIEEYLANSLLLLLLYIPVAFVLWFFNNKDRIKQINHNNFFNGLENLSSNEHLKIEIGVNQLTTLSKNSNLFDEEIKLAFIKRLKIFPKIDIVKEIRDKNIKLTYAQYILKWLNSYHKKNTDVYLDLNGADFSCQEFSKELKFNLDSPENPFSLLKKEKYSGLKFYESHLQDAYLCGANLTNANLQDANLQGADLRNADLTSADLQYAKLQGANLQGTILEGAELDEYGRLVNN